MGNDVRSRRLRGARAQERNTDDGSRKHDSTTAATNPPPAPPPDAPAPPLTPPSPPRMPQPRGGYPSCRSLTVVGNVGEISVQSAGPGHVSWGVTMYDRMIGFVFVFEQFKTADGKPGRNISRPYFYAGTRGTTHGSRSGLSSGSEYHLQALAIYTPMRAVGAASCIVP